MGKTKDVRETTGPTQKKVWGYQRQTMAFHGLNCRSAWGLLYTCTQKTEVRWLLWGHVRRHPILTENWVFNNVHGIADASVIHWYSWGVYLYFSSTSSFLVLTAVFIRHREVSRFTNLGDFYTVKHSSHHWNPNLRILVLFKYMCRDSVDFHVPIYTVTNKIKN